METNNFMRLSQGINRFGILTEALKGLAKIC